MSRILWPALWTVRFFFRLIRDFDGVFSFVFAKLFPSKYCIEGGCQKRGVCCQNIGIWMHPFSAKSGLVLWWVKWWYTFVYHFTCKGLDDSGHVMVFSCRYLKNNLCSIHWRRPFICRSYPIVRYFNRPVLLPGCGYRIKKKR